MYGYELFFEADQRQPNEPQSRPSPAELIDFACKEISSLVGTRRAFINLTRDVILSGCCDRLPATRVALEVLEDVPTDADVIAELTRLARLGYQIALDDFVPMPARTRLVDLAYIVKIDVLATGNRSLGDLAHELGSFDVRLLAEKIETKDTLRLAERLGFDYFQGFFLGRPTSEW